MSNKKSSATTPQYILAIDNGTQSVRALVFDYQGTLIAKSRIELEAYFSEQPGWAEQDPEYYWRQLGVACQALWDSHPDLQSQIAAVTLTTQRGTVVNLDSKGHPLRPAMLWLDQRMADDPPKLPWYWRAAFRLVGQTESVDYFRRQAESNWIAQHQPEIWEKTDKFLLLSGFLTYRLTGQFTDSKAACVGYLPFDYRKQRWANTWDWRWQALQMRPSQLPELLNPGQSLGHISETAAKHTGLVEGTPLIASASDKACEVLGSGGIDPSIGCLSFGTTATINTNNHRYVEPKMFIPPFPSAIPDQYNSEVMIYRGYWMVSWFKQEFGLKEAHLAENLGVQPEQLLEELVREVPPGSQGLMLQPYWSPGIKNLEAKGAVIGFGDVHTRAHLYRAILEGLAYALRDGKETLEKRQNKKIKRIRVSGGGSQSDAAMQLTADIFNLPAERPSTYETSGLGAAICAAVGNGHYADFNRAVAAMTGTAEVFKPIPVNASTYDRLYRDVYLKMYRQLKPLYKSIRDITGYPR